jgi:hypothetical protein
MISSSRLPSSVGADNLPRQSCSGSSLGGDFLQALNAPRPQGADHGLINPLLVQAGDVHL